MQILFNNTSIMPFKWRGRYLCFYCGKNYTGYTEFKKHTKSHGYCTTQDYALKIIRGNVEIKLDISEVVCEICNEPFGNFNEIVDHLISKHNMEYDKSIEIPFQEYKLNDTSCQFCGEAFTYFGGLVNHINLFHPQNSFICEDCGATFNKKSDLAMHFTHFHRQGEYPREECTEILESHNSPRRHQNDSHLKKCKTCKLSFASNSLLQKHIKNEHPDDGKLKCSHCIKEFQSSQGLKQSTSPKNVAEPRKKHDTIQIRKNIQCVLDMSTAVPFKFFSKFSCFYCSKIFVEFEDVKLHTTTEHPVCDLKSKGMMNCKGEGISVKIDVSSLACKICSIPIDSLDILIDHLISRHKAVYDKSVVDCLHPFKVIKDNIPCPHCSKVFRYFGLLLRHINLDHGNSNRICDFCGRCFKNAAYLKVHINYAHTGSCECEICGAKYKNQWFLGRHKAKCHNAKDYKCPKCPEQFQSQYHQQKHLIKEHDIGHKCTYCGKMFTRNSFMKDHIRRTHLKEKNVPCTLCNDMFFNNYLLKMHMIKHDGERKFSCDVCGKAFLRRRNLTTHMSRCMKNMGTTLQR